jgi:LuxR family maltose regulon positive regulatory protein
MLPTLLRTKLYTPPIRPELVSRQRLIERLSEGLPRGRRLSLVSAPAGFGKTTLVSDWLRHVTPAHVAWVSLDQGDNEPVRFWGYVLAALRGLPELRERGIGESAWSMLQSPQPPPIEAVLTDLINDLAETERGNAIAPDRSPQAAMPPLILVLDDLHAIANPEIHRQLAFLLDHQPLPSAGGLHLVIATRSDPPLPISRLRGRGQLTELTASELRFTTDEARTFLNQAMGLNLSIEDVAALDQRTEGWIAGLQMAAHALAGTRSVGEEQSAEISGFIAALTESHRYVLDYLADEVLLREPPKVQEFLLQTSILDRLCGPLCDAVTGRRDGQEMLERLDADNLFILPLDGAKQWYRYHGLFSELLRKRMKSRLADFPDESGEVRLALLNLRASEWYESAGEIEAAITHALAGQDTERAAALIERHAVEQMTHHRREATLAGWLDKLPEDLVRTRPWLCVYLGWTRYWRGMRDQVEACLQCAERGIETLDPNGNERRLVQGYIAAIRAHHALTNQEIERVIEMAQRAIACLPEGDYMRCEAAVALGGAYWSQGDVVAAQRAFSQARATALKSGTPVMAVPSSCYVAEQQTKRGQLRLAEGTYQQALEWATSPNGRRLPVAGFPLIKLGDLAREWNDLEAACRDLRQGVELCRQLGQADILCEGLVMWARLCLAQRDIESARIALQEVDRVIGEVSIDPWIATWADECRTRIWLSTGDWDAALGWAEERGLAPEGAFSYQHDLPHIPLARVLVAVHQANHDAQTLYSLDAVLDLLDRLLQAAQRAGWVHEQIEILLLQALAQQTLAQQRTPRAQSTAPAPAFDALSRALELAAPDGYLRTFLDHGPPMIGLLHQAASRGIHSAYVAQILAAADRDTYECAPESPATAGQPAPQPLLEPLSEREIEVLQLIAEGLTNREVGEQLYISPGTVKAHTSNIFGKLDVHSRTQAVARARALHILQ